MEVSIGGGVNSVVLEPRLKARPAGLAIPMGNGGGIEWETSLENSPGMTSQSQI